MEAEPLVEEAPDGLERRAGPEALEDPAEVYGGGRRGPGVADRGLDRLLDGEPGRRRGRGSARPTAGDGHEESIDLEGLPERELGLRLRRPTADPDPSGVEDPLESRPGFLEGDGDETGYLQSQPIRVAGSRAVAGDPLVEGRRLLEASAEDDHETEGHRRLELEEPADGGLGDAVGPGPRPGDGGRIARDLEERAHLAEERQRTIDDLDPQDPATEIDRPLEEEIERAVLGVPLAEDGLPRAETDLEPPEHRTGRKGSFGSLGGHDGSL